jgi:hypothetical protein
MNENDEFAGILGRLRGLYRAELTLAEAEPRHPRRRSGVQSRMQLPVAATMVAIVALAGLVATREGLLGPELASPGVGAQPPASPRDTQATPHISRAPSLAPTAIVTSEPTETRSGPMGAFPKEIDGEDVLVGSSVFERAASGSREPFLAAGWVVLVTADCYTDCGSGFVLRLSPPRTLGDMVGLRLPARPLDLHASNAVVLRVHRDDLSPTCEDLDSCLASVVVDEVVWVGAGWPGVPDD